MKAADYFEALRRRWIYLVTPLLLAIGLGLAYTVLATPVYRAQTVSFVSLRGGDSGGTLFQGSQFTLQRVKSYPQVVKSPDVLQPVIDELQLGTTVGALQNQVEAVNPADTVLINISATSSSAEQAADIANATTDNFARVVQDLERSSDDEDEPSPVRVTVTERATVPTSPVSPNLPINLILATIVGLGLGFALAMLRDWLDTSVRSSQELVALSGAPNLGTIPEHSGKDAPILVRHSQDSTAEAYRTLRTNLAFVDVDNPMRRILIASPVPREARSATACNLASAFAIVGLRACLVEADMRQPQLASQLGLPPDDGLSDVLAGACTMDAALKKWIGGSIITAGTPVLNPSELLSSHAMARLMNDLAEEFDVIILDSPPVLEASDAAILARTVDGTLLLTRAGSTRRADVREAADALHAVGARVAGSVLTFTKARSELVHRQGDKPGPERRGRRSRRTRGALPTVTSGRRATGSRASAG